MPIMPITPTNPFKGRQYPGEVILLAVRWYLRYPLAYLHVSEILTERGLFIDASCIWRWVQAYAPELDKRCRPHLKSTNKSYRVDETYIKVKAKTGISTVPWIPAARRSIFCGLQSVMRQAPSASFENPSVARQSLTESC